MSSKISALTDATSGLETDEVPVARSGANRRLTLAELHAMRGLMARARVTGANIDYADGANEIIDFNTVHYDPASAVTTGASWKYTAPATGWYDIRLVAAFVRSNGSTWSSGSTIQIDVYVNGSQINTLGYIESDGGFTSTQWFLLNGSCAASLTAADTLHLEFYNGSGATRRLNVGAGIEIYRVA